MNAEDGKGRTALRLAAQSAHQGTVSSAHARFDASVLHLAADDVIVQSESRMMTWFGLLFCGRRLERKDPGKGAADSDL